MFCLGMGISNGQNFVQRQDKSLYQNENEVFLRGMDFGNLVWDDRYADMSDRHHTEIDYQRIKDLGMNAIRFFLNYKTFENDNDPYHYKQSGWDWIDQNIKWAKAHNIYLILNINIPQGGLQGQCKGTALWTDPKNQDRFVTFWKTIAKKYKDETQIAGFHLLNEPTPTDSIQNWGNLAQKTISEIRKVGNKHLIIIDRALALGCDYGFNDANSNYPQINEENLMYTAHMFEPYEYSHQNIEWAGTSEGGKYPDETKIMVPKDATYLTGDFDNPSIKSGTSDWQEYKGSPFTVSVDSILCGRVVFVSNHIDSGLVYFDDFKLVELDANNNVIKTIFAEKLSTTSQWYWSANGTGKNSSSTSGHSDNFSVTITGNTSNAAIILPEFAFKVEKGKKYAISGWMKGENVPRGASATITTQYYYSPTHKPLNGRNYKYLVQEITNYTSYIEKKGIPVLFGGFGVSRPCFENEKGGAQWVKDCIHIFDSLGYHFTYHSYKESSFGYYDGWDQPVDPSTVNIQLQEIFKSYFETVKARKDPVKKNAIDIQSKPKPKGSH